MIKISEEINVKIEQYIEKKLKELLSSVDTNASLYGVDFVNFNGLASDYWSDNDIFLNFNDVIDFLNQTIQKNYLKEDMGIIVKTYEKAYGKYDYMIGHVITALEISRLREGIKQNEYKFI